MAMRKPERDDAPNTKTSNSAKLISDPNSLGPGTSKRWRILIFAGAVVLVAAALGTFGWNLIKPKPVATTATPAPKTTLTPTPLPKPNTVTSPLTGLQVTPTQATRPLSAVVIENFDPDARPQSGLQDAGVVYEANAEGGITRFLAFFLDNRPPNIGPVRSLRTYFVDWALEFNAPVAHAGGNADALDLIQPLGLKDINALSFAADGFFRTTDRAAPHNLYTNSDKMDALLQRLGYNTPANFTASPRKSDQPNKNSPNPHIHIDFSYSGYQVDWAYDANSNDYARNMAGAPHIDRNNGAQIHVKNIVVEMMPTSYGTTRIGESTVIMKTVGTGPGWLCEDGTCQDITWKKDSHTSRTQLIGKNGQNLSLNSGNTWYEIVPQGKNVSF
jgi:hypothetical protein